jgi:chemotaxis protein methyltransferase CheR
VWSAGCASGEEPYSLAIMWQLVLAPRFPTLNLGVIAVDFAPRLLKHAERATYRVGGLRGLPEVL